MANMTALSVEVTAPPVVPYRFGVFSVAPIVTPADPHAFVGINWLSVGCGQVSVTGDPCVVDAPAALAVNVPDCVVMNYEPFVVYTYSDMGFIGRGGDGSDAVDAAEAQLLAGEQFGVEDVLWGLIDAAVTSEVAIASANFRQGLAVVEQDLAEAYGGQGVIHMSRFTASMLTDLRVEGGRLVSPLGTPIVAGGGYDAALAGSVPTSVKMFGTGPLVLLGSTVESYPALNPATNQQATLAQRQYVVGWDCAAVGVNITL